MDKDRSTSICRENLCGTEKEIFEGLEKRTAHLIELARSVLPSDIKPELNDAPALFERAAEETELSRLPAHGGENAGFFGGAVAVSDRACLAGYIKRRFFPSLSLDGFVKKSEPPKGAEGKIAYFKGPAADTAFDIFAARINDPSILYGHDFASVCESVYYGKAQFCILPVSSSNDGLLPGFYATAEKYELTGVDECSVTYADNETRFVLFSGGVPERKGGRHIKTEILVPHDKSIKEIVCAAAVYGADCTGVDRLPAEFGTSDMLTFSGAPERICDLLFFLYCEQINFDITGVFENEDM